MIVYAIQVATFGAAVIFASFGGLHVGMRNPDDAKLMLYTSAIMFTLAVAMRWLA